VRRTRSTATTTAWITCALRKIDARDVLVRATGISPASTSPVKPWKL
jgi:hypothetical protein